MSTAEPRTNKFELPRGASVGKYEILRKIATGGMAEIYLARVRGTAGFEKLVVLKRILPQVAEDPSFVQMFLDEARLSSTLQHPNIADVYDVGEADGQYFFTMEFVHGQDCRTIRHEMKKRNEPVPLAASLAIVHGTVSALDHAHDKRGPDGKLLGLVHRDVSASNIMVSYDGAVKLLDFGIARVMSTTHKTQVGTLKGKIPYMSPEQCKGLPLDRRSDLFSLGVVLYELTVGRRPFRGDSDFAIMDQIVYQGAAPPSSLMTGYPAELEAIVMKCLERDPKARYTTGDELVEDLEAFTQQFGLWISPKQLGKYMRTVFADRIKAWEEAEAAGVPFMQHVTESITSQSQQSELVTPPSAFPALPARQSQVMAAQSPEVVQSLRPTPTSMPAAEPPKSGKSIDELHAKLGQKQVPPKSPTRPIPAVSVPLPGGERKSGVMAAQKPGGVPAETAAQKSGAVLAPPAPRKTGALPTLPMSPRVGTAPPQPQPKGAFAPAQERTSALDPPAAPYTPPAQLPFAKPDKGGDGWDAPTTRYDGEPDFGNEAPTTSQPEEELARALAADPDAGATMRAPAHADPDAAATFQGMKAASVAKAAALGAPPAPAKTLYGTPPAPVLAPPPVARPQSEGIDDEQITGKPIQIARPMMPDPAAPLAPAPALQSAPVPSLKPTGNKVMLVVLAGVLLIGAGIGGYVMFGGGSKAASTSVEPGSDVHATPTPVAPEPSKPAVAPEPDKPTAPAVAPEPTKPEPATAEPAATPEPAKPEPAPAVPEPKKTPTPAKAPVRQVTPTRPPVAPHRPPPANPPKHPKAGDGTKQDSSWDPNSPFLPGQ